MDSKRDPISMASQVVDVALKAGAEAADAFVRSSSSLSMSVRNGEVESLQKASTFGLGLRVMVDSRTVLVHTTDTSRISLLKLVTRAVDMARTLPEPKEPILFGSPQDVESLPHPDPALAGESSETKTGRLRAIEKAMLAVNGVTRSGGVSYDERDSEDALVNSEGVRLYAPTCSISIHAEAIAERDGESYTGGRYLEVPARRYLLDPETIGRDAGQRAAELLGARPVPTTRAPVIFTPYTGWTMMRCLVNPVRGDNVVQQRSYLSGQIGHRIAARGVNIRDNALLARGASCHAFDGEGTPSQNLQLIRDGVLQSYLTDLSSAARLGVPPGGNAVRESYSAKPGIDTSNFYMEPGSTAPEAILKQTDRALMLASLSGWWVGTSPVVDTFSSAAMGFWIENGEVIHPVKGVTIGGSLREMFQSIDLIGNDLSHTAPTSTPTFRVAEMVISGL